MRDELTDLLGQPVVLAGRLNRCEPNAIGSLNVCLKAVDVYPWRTDVAISALTPVRIDHGWLQMSNLRHALGGLVEMYWMTAEVTNYQRRNGSRDIGFRHRPSLCLDHLLDNILNIDKHDQQVGSIEAALRRIQTGEDVFGFHFVPKQIEKILQRALKPDRVAEPKKFLQAQAQKIKRTRNTSWQIKSTTGQGFLDFTPTANN